MKRGFGSDNNSGVHPAVLKAISNVNKGHTHAYGHDPYTVAAEEKFKEHFGPDISTYFVFNGTAANVLSIKTATRSYNSVICAGVSHINNDECGAPEKYTGCKLLTIPTPNGKITVPQIRSHMRGIGFEHRAQPRVISITQPTELGTVYRPEEIEEITHYAHAHDLIVHMDGARLANAAVFLDTDMCTITGDAGVDILSFGGTKNGMMYGEAIIFFKPSTAKEFQYIRKQGMQLASKMRFIAAQFHALLSDDLWRKNARHANQMAKSLAERVADLPGIRVTQTVESNGVFAVIPEKHVPALCEKYFFYIWDEKKSEARWMTSFDTAYEDIQGFVKLMKKIVK